MATSSGGVVRVDSESVLERELDRILTAEWDRLLAVGWEPSRGVVPVELGGRCAGHAGAGSPRRAVGAGVGWSVPESVMPESVMPGAVQAALRALLAAAAPGALDVEAAGGGLEGLTGRPDGLAGQGEGPDGEGLAAGAAGASGVLAVVEAAGAVRGWADAVMVDATRALFEWLRPVAAGGPAAEGDVSVSARERALAEARALVVDEVEAATGAGRTQCQKLVGFATAAPARTAAARAAMRGGRCEFYRAQLAQHATAGLDPEVADGITADVLGARPDGTCWSHPQFRARLRRRVLRHQDPEQRRKTHQQAVADRGAWTTLQDDGTGELAITGDAPKVVAARERVEAIARAVRRHGDPRTLAQLRSDVALDLLTHGTVPPLPTPLGEQAGGAEADPWAVYRAIGDLPPARVQLTVPLTTLLGLSEEGTGGGVGELAGYGPLDAAQARQVAFAPGSTWTRIVTDPLTGWAIDRSTHTYRPDPAMAALVRTRDGTTREPGSTTPAAWPTVDLDHHIPYATDAHGHRVGGPTSAANLYALTRRAHNRKTRGHWTYQVNTHGLCTWTTTTGRTYTTAPADYDELTGHRDTPSDTPGDTPGDATPPAHTEQPPPF